MRELLRTYLLHTLLPHTLLLLLALVAISRPSPVLVIQSTSGMIEGGKGAMKSNAALLLARNNLHMS